MKAYAAVVVRNDDGVTFVQTWRDGAVHLAHVGRIGTSDQVRRWASLRGYGFRQLRPCSKYAAKQVARRSRA